MQELTLKDIFKKLNNATEIMDLYYNFNDEEYCLYIEITVPGSSTTFNGYFKSIEELEKQLKLENRTALLKAFKVVKNKELEFHKSLKYIYDDPDSTFEYIEFYFSIDKIVRNK